jgi:hypothetical protein
MTRADADGTKRTVNNRFDYEVPAGVLTADDDDFHTPRDDDWWQIETNWVWFFVPERKLGCWIYHLVRPTIGVDSGSIQVWDDSAWHHTEVPYYRHVMTGRLPARRDLRDHTFSTAFRWTVVEPLERYRLRFEDERVCSFDLEWTAIMDPWAPPKGNPPAVTHLDQFGHVTGELVLHGEKMAVDCYAMRDRSWQITRPEGWDTSFWGAELTNGYMTAAADARTAFFGTRFVVLDGHLSPVVESEVRRERDRNHGFLRRIVVTGTDEDGRHFEASGHAVSRMIVPIPGVQALSVNSLMDYRINGIQAWGDDQDSWGLGTWAAMRRRQMGLFDVRVTPSNTGVEIA